MAFNADLRRRVERLIAGPFRVEDLNSVYLGLRERFFARRSFQEIGHFVAHAGERNVGLVPGHAQDHLDYLRFRLPAFDPRQTSWSISGTDLGRALKAQTRLTPEASLPQNRAQMASLIGRIERKVTRFSWTRPVEISRDLTDNEKKLLNNLIGTIQITPALTESEVFEDFCYVLLRNDLVDERGQKALERLRPLIAMYALWRMHGCNLRLRDGDEAPLRASWQHDGSLSIFAHLAAFEKLEGGIVAIPLYTIETAVADRCEEGIFDDPEVPIELSDEGRLIRI